MFNLCKFHTVRNVMFWFSRLKCCVKNSEKYLQVQCTSQFWAYGFSDVYRSFMSNKTTFTKYFLIQLISKLLGSFEIYWVRQCLVNFTGLAGIMNETVYKTEPIFTGLGHSKFPDNKVHGVNMGPTWVLSAQDGPHVGPMNPAIRVVLLFNTENEFHLKLFSDTF